MKKLVGKLHLWLGMASGLVVMVVALTGCIWTFEREISDLVYPYRTVEVQPKPMLSPAKLLAIAQPLAGKHPVGNINLDGPSRAAVLTAYGEEAGQEFRITTYLNPYTGAVLHTERGHTLFDIILELHVNLMLGDVGKRIVDFSTLFFVVLLITGIVLWWPKNKAAARQRTWFRWKPGTKWRRQNYDLHNILGFYASWVVIFIAITGLAWGFEWVDKTLYAAATLGAPYQAWAEPKSVSDSAQPARADLLDAVAAQTVQAYGKPYESLSIYRPASNVPNAAITCYIYPSARVYYSGATYHYDQRSGQPLLEEHFEQYNNGQKLRSMYYDIHIGKILGLPGQLLVFFGSLIVASLPVTGTLIWWGRRKKQATARRVPVGSGRAKQPGVAV
jgi:uncharacterized iron-regulated membrane protein